MRALFYQISLQTIKENYWPIDNGVVVGKYGKQKHEVFSGVETFNNGIDIATNKNTAVRSIFDGKISRIFLLKERKSGIN